MPTTTLLAAFRATLGTAQVLTEPTEQAPYLTDWRKRYQGQALAVLRPANTAEVATVVKLCHAARVAIVPQGGNTGLCGGATPTGHPPQVVLSLQRMRQIRAIDPDNLTITVDAGCPLQAVQEAAQATGRLFPLSLASEGSCTIGGNLSTNAGGTAVLRYGNARELCLGLEVVTAAGEIWDGLRALRKDNTGYDLRDLFIGAEGTLGIITAAVMKLVPAPRAQVTSLATVTNPQAAIALLQLAQNHAGCQLTGFELFSQFCLELVLKHFPHQRSPFKHHAPYYVLLELSDHESAAHAEQVFEVLLGEAFERGIVQDAVVAQSSTQSRQFWALREHISEAQAAEGKNIKHDIALPISHIADFITSTDAAIQAKHPHVRMVTFGHLGDGNLHYNVAPPLGGCHEDFLKQQAAIHQIVYDQVAQYRGTFSAEHGIGQLKVAHLAHYKSAVEMRLMRSLKDALDPLNLMNPGKILDHPATL